MKVKVGDTYRLGNHIGIVNTCERFLDKDNDWHYGLVVHFPGHPDGEWFATHGKEEDFEHESIS
jgi:hypothetical protein